jgi:hypothetical protein
MLCRLEKWINRNFLSLFCLVLALGLIQSCIAFAQPLDYSTGGNLKRRQYQTYSNLTLFVDGTNGSDMNACTSATTGACASFTAAIAKVPHSVRHTVTINVAAGTYTPAMQVVGLTIARASEDLAGAAAINITGTQIPPTLTTGATTGTLTSASAPSGATLGVFTDSGQTWTVNELRGQFFKPTSGAQSGNFFVIQSNTATTVTLATAANVSAIVSGITYAITTPGAVFTGGTRFQALNGGGTITFTDIAFVPSVASNNALTLFQNMTAFTFTRIRSITGTVGVLSVSTPPMTLSDLRFNSSYLSSATVGGCTIQTVGVSTLFINGGEVRNSGASGAALCIFGNLRGASFFIGHFEAPGPDGVIFLNTTGGYGGEVRTATALCTAAGGFGLQAHQPRTNNLGNSGLFGITTFGIKSCDTGISILSPMEVVATGVTIDTAVTGLEVNGGGVYNFRAGGSPTFTTVTNQLSLDDSLFTYGFFSGLSSPVMTGPFGSRFISQ